MSVFSVTHTIQAMQKRIDSLEAENQHLKAMLKKVKDINDVYCLAYEDFTDSEKELWDKL